MNVPTLTTLAAIGAALAEALGALALGWALAVAVVSAVALLRRLRLVAPSPCAPSCPILVVRPCRGAEPGLLERLATPPRGLPGHACLRLTVADPDDPALPIAEEAARRLRARGIDAQAEVVQTDAVNQKAGQLAVTVRRWATLQRDPHRFFVNLDSDVEPDSVCLAELLAPLSTEARGRSERDRRPIGAVWMPTAERLAATPADHASAAFLNRSLHAFPLLGALEPSGLVGKVMAARVTSVERAGGLESLCGTLGEDMELARRLLATGARPWMHPSVAVATVTGRTADAVHARYVRWLTMIRTQRPGLRWSYPLLFGATTPLVALGVLAALGGATSGALAAVVALTARWAVDRAASRCVDPALARLSPPHAVRPTGSWLLDTLRADRLILRAWRGAQSEGEVRWRGRTLRVTAGGQMVPVDERPAGERPTQAARRREHAAG